MVYLSVISLIKKNLIFIIIGTGAIWIASMLSICILLDQVGRLSKLMFQLAKVFKALFGALPGEARRLECISFFLKSLHYLES